MSSLLIGRDVLKQEGVWQLGTGNAIQLYSDPWLHKKPGFRVEGDYHGEPNHEPQVSSLFGVNGKWNELKIHQHVSVDDAALIIQMSIPYTRTEDKFLWPHTKNGETRARSVYHRLRELQGDDNGQTYTQNTDLWRAIWGAYIIPNAKNFVWRLTTNSIVVKMNLIRRSMIMDRGCPVCGEDETREHMMVGCRWTEDIWTEILGTRMDQRVITDVIVWLDDS